MSDASTVPGRDELPVTEQSPTIRARFRAIRDDQDVRDAVRGGALFVGGLALNAPVTVGVTAGLAVKAVIDRSRPKITDAANV